MSTVRTDIEKCLKRLRELHGLNVEIEEGSAMQGRRWKLLRDKTSRVPGAVVFTARVASEFLSQLETFEIGIMFIKENKS